MSSSSRRLPTLDDIQTEKAERHFRDYVRPAWPVIEPGTEYLHNWHIDAIGEYLEAVTAGQIRRLIINIPPRNMKSILVSVDWPTWSWLRRPELRFLFSSYSQSLSTKHNIDRRTIIQSAWYQQRWGDRYRLRGDQNLKTEFQNDHRGHMIATSVGGTSTGKGGDILVTDDPMNPKIAASELQREGVNQWLDQTWYSRLDDKKRGAMVMVMQRLHERDATGHLLAKQGDWEHLCLPAEAEQKTIIILPGSKREIVREPGDILWPEREGPKELADAKIGLGSYGYAGQYQQAPAPSEGGILKKHWWRYWRPRGVILPPVIVRLPEGEYVEIEAVEIPEQFDTQLQSWDMTFKETSDSDFVAGGAWGQQGANSFLLDMINERMDFPKSVAAVDAWAKRFLRARPILIEDKANGPAVISTLRNKVGGILPVEPQGGKEARAHAVSPYVEAGNVYLPHPLINPLTEVLILQCAQLPRGANDDLADMTTQALLRLQQAGIGEIPAASTATMEQLAGQDGDQVDPTMARSTPPDILLRRR